MAKKALYPDDASLDEMLKAERATVKQLEALRTEDAARLTEMRGERDRNRTIAEQWKAKADEAEKANDILKDELHRSEIENARLKGYIDRVDMDLPDRPEPTVTLPLSHVTGPRPDPHGYPPFIDGITARPLPWWRRK